MKTVDLKKSPGAARDINAATKQGYILLTRGGKPVAYVLPTRFYDEEDLQYMTDPAFWKMVRQWRQEKGEPIPLEDIEAGLAKSHRPVGRNAKEKNGNKVKRNGTARN